MEVHHAKTCGRIDKHRAPERGLFAYGPHTCARHPRDRGDRPSPPLTPMHGSALYFDGQDDYVLVSDNPSLDLHSSFTIAAWIYLEEYTEWASLVTKGDKPNINNYAIHQSDPFDPLYKTDFGNLRFSGSVGLPAPLPESETLIPLRSWQFVAVTFDGVSIRFYLNGKGEDVIVRFEQRSALLCSA